MDRVRLPRNTSSKGKGSDGDSLLCVHWWFRNDLPSQGTDDNDSLSVQDISFALIGVPLDQFPCLLQD